jgi:hypothetical protein
MRKLKIIEPISLDGVIQHSADGDDFRYRDWTAPYRTPAGRDAMLAAHGEPLSRRELGGGEVRLWINVDGWPDPHPALRATFSPREKEGVNIAATGYARCTIKPCGRNRLAQVRICGSRQRPLGAKIPIQNMPEAKTSLRKASLCCLAIWAAVGILFLAVRFAPFDIREIPGIGPIMLAGLGVALLAPVVAIGLAAAALVRQPRASLNWLALGCALIAMFGLGLLFMVTRWL